MRRLVCISIIALFSWACSDDSGTITPKGDGPVSNADKGTGSDTGGQKDLGSKVDGSSAISFGKVVWPIFKAGCSCHIKGPTGKLSMPDQATAYAGLVGVAASQCSTMKLVEAGDPTKSYLIQKLEGKGGCFMGVKMPKGGSLTAAQITAIKGWITAGAAK